MVSIGKIGIYAPVFAVLVLPLVALSPLQNIPAGDDWAYAWSVENLLNNHTLKILDWSVHINIAQILWGTLFCLPFGFSFAALRLSTWVLSVLGLVGFYLLMRELGLPDRDKKIAIGVLACSPLYAPLSFTFMTDIPAISFSTWSLFCFIKGMNSGRTRWLLLGSAFSMMMIATRLIGVTIPLAIILFSFLPANFRARNWSTILIGGVLPLMFAAFLITWHSYHVEHRADLTWFVGSAQSRIYSLPFAVKGLHYWLVITFAYMIAPFGFMLAPVTAGCAKLSHFRKVLLALGLVAAVFIVAAFLGLPLPLRSEGTWAELVNLQGSYTLVSWPPTYSVPLGWNLLAGTIGALLFVFAIAPALSSNFTPALRILVCVLLMQFLFTGVLWLWGARYFLALVPPLLVLILASAPVVRQKSALAIVAVFAVVSLGILHDELEYNRTLWEAVDHLQEIGAPLSRINGGYMVNGWLQYAHKENAKINAHGDVEVEFVNAGSDDVDYKISNQPMPGWATLKEFPYVSWIGRSGRIYVLVRDP
jgi:Dolichyl-phosphate-mannose-protein mannosyltransferase